MNEKLIVIVGRAKCNLTEMEYLAKDSFPGLQIIKPIEKITYHPQDKVDEVEILIKQYARLREKYSLEFDEMNIGGGYGIKYTEEDSLLSIYELGEVVISAMNENCEKYAKKMRIN